MNDKVRKKRLKMLQNYLRLLEKNPESWNILHRTCVRNVSTLDMCCSIFHWIPNKLVDAKHLSSHIKKWEVFKVEWYKKQLSSHYADSWIPISDFESGQDEMFVDISDERLPILITKFTTVH